MTYQKALEAAKSNAEYFGRMYAVFISTMNKFEIVSNPRDTHVAFAIVLPDGRVEASWTETTVRELRTRIGD